MFVICIAYSRYLAFFLISLHIFWNIKKELVIVFLTLNICRRLTILVISFSQWKMSSVTFFIFSYLKKNDADSCSAWFLSVTQKHELQVSFKIKECWHHLLYADLISLFATRKCPKSKNLMEVVNIDKGNLHIFQTTWGILIKV